MRLEAIEEIALAYPDGYSNTMACGKGTKCPCPRWVNCHQYMDRMDQERRLKDKANIDFDDYMKRFGNEFKMSESFGNG